MGTLGFSYIGLLYLIMLMIPNLIWVKHMPKNYDAGKENRILLLCERVGQVLVTCIALIFSDFNLRPWSIWSLWLAASFALMLLYEYWWITYFKSARTMLDFYGKLGILPVPGAILLVLSFILPGMYGRNIWMMIAITILGIGHIGIHLQHQKELK